MVHDTLMRAFACMYFQDTSLLAFQARLEKKHQRSNMQTIFRVRRTQKDSQLLDLIDRITAATLALPYSYLIFAFKHSDDFHCWTNYFEHS